MSARRFFQITAFCFGLGIIFIIPPFQVPDEPDHFERAFHLAAGHFLGEQQDQRLGGQIPESVARLEAIYLPMKFDYAGKQNASKFETAKSIELHPEITIFQDFPNTGLYPFTVYLPQILVIKAGVFLNIKPLYLLYLCRLFNLLFWIFLISKAIDLMPARQWFLAFLAVLPGALFINASASGDVVTNGLAFLILAFCYRIIVVKDEKINFAQMGWLALGIGILAWNKFVYAPVLLLTFLFPQAAFSQAKYRNLFAWGLLLVAVAIVTVWNIQTSELFLPQDVYNPLYKNSVTLNEGVSPKAQFDFIINHPFSYLKILSLSFIETAPATIAHYFGKFGWEKNYLPGWAIGLLLLTTIFLSLQKSACKISIKAKIAFVAIAIIMSAALATTLYMMWAPVGHGRILTLSGKYFIPILPLVWLAMPGLFQFKYQKQLVVMVTVLGLTLGLVSAYARYY